SMGAVEQGRTRSAAARAAGAELLRSLRPSDRVACAAFSDRLETPDGRLAWTDAGACRQLLERGEPGRRTTDFAAALRPARELLARSSPGRKRAVLLLSDGAAHGLRPGAAADIPVLALDWPAAPFNAAALSASAARGSSPERPCLRVRLWAAAGRESSLDLWRGGSHLAATAVALRAGEAPPIELALPAAAEGSRPEWSGRVELRPDALAADDSWFFSFAHPRRRRLVVLYGNPAFLKAPEAGYFLKELFGGAKGRLLEWDAEFASLERLRSGELGLSGFDAAVLADFRTVPAVSAAALESFVRAGGGLWILPGRQSGAALAALADWLPAEVDDAGGAAARGLRVAAASGPFAGWSGFELDQAALRRCLRLSPRPGAETWLRDGSGEPLLVGAAHGEGRVVVFGAPLDAVSGNLPVKPVYAALVSAAAALSLPPPERAESFSAVVGEPLTRVWSAREAAPAMVSVRAPDGRLTRLWVKDRRARYDLADRPGLYVMDDGAAGRVYAVNLDRSTGESDPAPAAAWPRLRPESLREEFWLRVSGRDARGAALLAAAALLLVEMVLAAPRAAATLLLGLLLAGPAAAQEGDRFVWTQLKLGPDWDPYPTAPAEAVSYLAAATSVLVEPRRRAIAADDPALLRSPLVILAGRQAPPPLDAETARRLGAYLAAGGTIWIEDVSGGAVSPFDRWVRCAAAQLLPDAALEPLDADHVVYRTFFLLRAPAGRVLVRGTLEGVSWGGRTPLIYSRNDLLGPWVKDALGRPLLPCLPGGEAQCHEARKLAINVIMYALTGSYKADAVHQPYLLQKLRSGLP
ncbi:MAG: DUF4159 domain-containing protein, partial [Elusimicrobia bacterium]|nr:DUF4159 domain-containing protein [Elusimicrobiota bacterium]